MIEPLLAADEVRRILKVSLATVYNMAERGQLPCVRWDCIGNGKRKPRTMVKFKPEDIRAFIERHYSST
ncbi:MAG: helix-turn-helix domain-containing protein [Desulfobacterales bacterium]|nr:MAG: helix-turn-helix domain-containing protein [Desulfobacterales bacterium]